jgi:hypothetical protein
LSFDHVVHDYLLKIDGGSWFFEAIVYGESLREILQAFTRYSANAPEFPVNDAPLLTGLAVPCNRGRNLRPTTTAWLDSDSGLTMMSRELRRIWMDLVLGVAFTG